MKFNFFSQHNPEILAQLIQQKNLPLVDGDLNVEEHHQNNVNSNYLLITNHGKIDGYIEAELALYLQKKLIQTPFLSILDAIDEGVIIIDENARVYYINPAYTKILGVYPKRVLGKHLSNLEKNPTLIHVLKTREPIEKTHHHIESIDKYINVKMNPLYAYGKLVGAFSVFNDLTEVVTLNQKVVQITNLAQNYEKRLKYKDTIRRKNIIGKDRRFLNLLNQAITVAPTDAPVLILGESGSGKEIIANLIHSESLRVNQPYVTLNCSAVPENLIESELFGFEGGAFTDAMKKGKLGKVEQANHGTLFLDEIGDMSLAMQAKLLRTLETGEIEKIGSEKKIKVDVRIVSATNRNISALIKEGKFREDLYYRISVVNLLVPALRERRHDIVLFIDYFLKKYEEKYNKTLSISNEVYQILLNYDWPGNVREIKNCIEHMVILANDDIIRLEDLPKQLITEDVLLSTVSLEKYLEEKEKSFIQSALYSSQGSLVDAAKLLNISERTLYRKLTKYDIK